MKILFRLFLLTGLVALICSQSVSANSAGNSTTVDIDEATGTAVDDSSTDMIAGTVEEPLYPMSPERYEKLVSYSRFKNVWRFVDFLVGLAVMALILFTGLAACFRDWVEKIRPRFFAIWVFLILVMVADYILYLPFSIYRGFVVEGEYGFMNQAFLEWWGEDLLGLLVGLILGILPMWFFYWVVSNVKRWWLTFSLGLIPFIVLIVVIVPVVVSPLFNEFGPLEDKQLEAEILALADSVGIEGADIFQVNASKQSSKINAYVTGLFGTKRIVLFDTLIDNFTHGEIRFVVGHEMGHYLMNHMWWGLGVTALFMIFGLWLVNRTIHGVIHKFSQSFRFNRLSDIASLPLVLVFVSVIFFVFQPVTNGFSRMLERQADAYGMEVSGVSGETAATAFDKLAVLNLADPDPHPVIEFWFYNHPALKKRMAFVKGLER